MKKVRIFNPQPPLAPKALVMILNNKNENSSNQPIMKLYKLITISLILSFLVSCKSKQKEIVHEIKTEDKATGLNEPKIYKLKKQLINADFDYSKLDDIDNNYGLFHKPKKRISAFEPKNGKYNYYQFIATFKGSSYNGGAPTSIKEFKDILIIKTNNENQIIDAYQYTLEWSEPPFQYDVYKASAKHLKLTDHLMLESLQLKRTYSRNENNTLSNEKGIIKLQ